MPVAARSGLRAANNTLVSSSQREEHGPEAQERPSKRRQSLADSEDQQPQPGADAPGVPTFPMAQASDRPELMQTGFAEPEPEHSPPGSEPLLRTVPRRDGRYLGRGLGTGRRVVTTPSPRLVKNSRPVRNRPPTPYSQRMSLPLREPEEHDQEDDWEPSIVIGRSLGENLSRAERAWRVIRQWEVVYEHTLRSTPDAVGPILEQLEQARKELDEMEMTEENTIPINDLPSTHQAAVEDRLETLNAVLATSECSVEATNIRAAMEAYRTSAIHTHRWTLFWNGHLVDSCESYAAFCGDRGARLDRYEREYGPGWLWYEAPLEGEGPTALRATHSVQNPSKWDMGSWNITMGFRRVKAYVSRDGTAKPPLMKPTLRQRQPGSRGLVTSKHKEVKQIEVEKAAPRAKKGTRASAKKASDDYTLADDPEAPLVYIDVLLDSGATMTLLYEQDFNALGINKKTYPAQSVTSMSGVGSSFDARIYEMRATITNEAGKSLVDPQNPVHPGPRKELGAVVPVAVLPRQGAHAPPPPSPVQLRGDGSRKRARSRQSSSRLSGMLPFMACYISVVPGSKKVWLGEDRRDVLGAQKFPGQRRLFGNQGGERERALRDMAGRVPEVRFEHALPGGGKLVDEETDGGASEVRVWDMEGTETGFCRVDPRKRMVRFDK